MSLEGVNLEKVQRLGEHYRNKTPLKIGLVRSPVAAVYYAALGELPPGFLRTSEAVKAAAMREAIDGSRDRLRGILSLAPMKVNISPEDLDFFQRSSNNLLIANHQKDEDIGRLAELSAKLGVPHRNMQFVMRVGLTGETYFKLGGGILMERGRDIKKREEKGDFQGDKNIINPQELPHLLGEIMQKPGIHIAAFGQGTRMRDPRKAFYFKSEAIESIQEQLDHTDNTTEQFMVAIDYRNKDQCEIHVKRIPKLDEGRGDLGEVVNGFFGSVKDSK